MDAYKIQKIVNHNRKVFIKKIMKKIHDCMKTCLSDYVIYNGEDELPEIVDEVIFLLKEEKFLVKEREPKHYEISWQEARAKNT